MQFKKTTLKNGLRVITVPMIDNPSVTVLVMVEAGSKYESKEINGLSHFLEHMVFKGTPQRPKAIDISRELDSIGANYNAFTSQEMTGYYAKADKKHFDTILDIVSDMYLNPLFPEQEIEKEKGVIIEEIRMYNDLPQRKVQEEFSALLFGDQPAGWSVLGSEAHVRSFNREKLIKYRAEHYLSSTTTVIVAGNIDEKESVAMVEKAFSKVSDAEAKGKIAVKEVQKVQAVKTVWKDTDQTHLVIGVRTFSLFDDRIPVMLALSTLLGGGMSSRLFAKMRDELGICYYIGATHEAYTDHGDLTIAAGVDNSRTEEGIRGILDECLRLKEEMVGEAELKKVKDYIAGTTMLGLETSEARAEFCGFQEVLKRAVESPEELIAKVQNVTAQQIQKMAQEIFVNESLNMAIVGKFKDETVFRPYFKF